MAREDTVNIWTRRQRVRQPSIWEVWPGRVFYLLSVLCALSGPKLFTHFPQLIYTHGHSAFLIAFLGAWLAYGLPMVTLETALGQYLKGPVHALGTFGILRGVGYGILAYNAISLPGQAAYVTYNAHYFHQIASGQIDLMTKCDNHFNTAQCCDIPGNVTDAFSTTANCSAGPTGPAEYWRMRRLEGMNRPVDQKVPPGTIHWDFAAICATVWLLAILFTCLGPVSVSVCLAVALTFLVAIWLAFATSIAGLPGASGARREAFQPDWSILKDYPVWTLALHVVGDALCLGSGLVVTMASYNRPQTSFWIETLAIGLLFPVIMLTCTAIVYSLFGYAIQTLSLSGLTNYLEPAHGGSYEHSMVINYLKMPIAFAIMPDNGAEWAATYYAMQALLGFTGLVASLEVINRGILNAIERCYILKRMYIYRPIIAISSGLILATLSLIFCTTTGASAFRLVNKYTMPVLVFEVCEILALGGYFIYRACRGFKFKPRPKLMKAMVTSLIVLIGICLLFLVVVRHVFYLKNVLVEDSSVPAYERSIAWLLLCLPLVVSTLATICVIINIARRNKKGSLQKLFRPEPYGHPSSSDWYDGDHYWPQDFELVSMEYY